MREGKKQRGGRPATDNVRGVQPHTTAGSETIAARQHDEERGARTHLYPSTKFTLFSDQKPLMTSSPLQEPRDSSLDISTLFVLRKIFFKKLFLGK